MSFIAVAVGGALAIGSGIMKANAARRGAGARADEARDARAEMEKYRSEYMNLDTSNLAANLQNRFEGMENTFEDMTVNLQQARFEAQQGEQQRINTMRRLQSAAGGSGIAALAQAMAIQGQLATQRASASIGAQEAAIQKLRAGEASKIQMAERAGAAKVDALQVQGAETSRALEYQKTGTLLGMEQQRLGAANQAIAEAQAQEMSAYGDIAAAGTQMAISGLQAYSSKNRGTGKYTDKTTGDAPTSGYDRRVGDDIFMGDEVFDEDIFA